MTGCREAEMKWSFKCGRGESKQQLLKREIRWRLANLDWRPMYIPGDKPRVRYKLTLMWFNPGRGPLQLQLVYA